MTEEESAKNQFGVTDLPVTKFDSIRSVDLKDIQVESTIQRFVWRLNDIKERANASLI